MRKSKITSGVDYVATFFANNRMNSQLLSDVLKSRGNLLMLEALNLPSDFILPFVREERDGNIVYSLKHGENKAYEVMLHDSPCENRILQSGDYFTFRNHHNGKIVHVLFIATSDIAPAYRKYTLSKNANVFIGRSSSNDIVYGFSGYVSRDKQAVIQIDNNRAFVENLNKKVGLYVNGYLADFQLAKEAKLQEYNSVKTILEESLKKSSTFDILGGISNSISALRANKEDIEMTRDYLTRIESEMQRLENLKR